MGFRDKLRGLVTRGTSQSSQEITSIELGDLTNNSLTDILADCEQRHLTGKVILKRGSETGAFVYRRGKIIRILMTGFTDDEAFSHMLSWQSGQYAIRPSMLKSKEVHGRDVIQHTNAQYRVLIVSLNKLLCKLFEVKLGERGHKIIVTESGVQALELIQNWRPHLIVSDVELPDASCEPLIRQIRALGNVPVILLTSAANQKYYRDFARNTPNIFLTESDSSENALEKTNIVFDHFERARSS